jgi:hypothetical protein
MEKKKVAVLMDADVHEKLKEIQAERELKSISSAIRQILKEVK